MSDEMNVHASANKSGDSSGKSVFDAIPSKTSFYAGLATGVMAFATVGFFLMMAGNVDWAKLGLSKGGNVWAAKPNANANANVNSAPENKLANLPMPAKNDHVRGDLSKAEVVMIEYSDFECPFCKNFQQTMNSVFSAYGGKVAWIYRHLPLSFHANAQKEAEASECVAELGGNEAFWKFTDRIYERTASNGTGFALDKLGPLAKEVGVDQKKFQECLDSGKFEKKVTDDANGAMAAGIDGTPGTAVLSISGESQVISGAQDESRVKAVIDAMLK